MRKKILLIGSLLLCGLGIMAQTVKMEWNRYAQYPSAYYQAVFPIEIDSKNLQKNDVITVRIAGVADNDIDDFQITIINEDAPTYWNEITEFGFVGDIKAGVAFDRTVELIVKKGLANPKLVLSGRNSVLSATEKTDGPDIIGQGGKGSDTFISLSLSKNEITLVQAEGAAILVENWDGKNQTSAIQNKIAGVTINEELQISISGKSNVDAKELQIVLVDGTPHANYWKELSAWTDFTNATITAGTDFEFTTTMTITALPIGEGAAALQFYLVAASESSIMKIDNFAISIVPVKVACDEKK